MRDHINSVFYLILLVSMIFLTPYWVSRRTNELGVSVADLKPEDFIFSFIQAAFSGLIAIMLLTSLTVFFCVWCLKRKEKKDSKNGS